MSEQTTVWVLSEGKYSNRSNVAAFSTLEALEAFRDGSGKIYNEPEELSLDCERDPMLPSGHWYWYVVMDHDGNTREAGQAAEVYSDGLFWDYLQRKVYFGVGCIARDVEHAVKIANERRAQSIADGTWEREEQKVLDFAREQGYIR